MGYNKKRKFSALLVHVALIVVCLICVFPVIWMTLISFKSVHESMTGFAFDSSFRPNGCELYSCCGNYAEFAVELSK